MLGGDHHKVHFVSCSGSTTVDLLDSTKPDNQINAITNGASFATLSIGGNDVLFGLIVKSCIYGVLEAGDCTENKKKGTETLYGRAFFDRYNEVLTRIVKEKMGYHSSVSRTLLYQTSYSQFFDDWTDDCDNRKLHWWVNAKKMKKPLREEFNHMVHQLNEILQYWMDIRNTEWTRSGWIPGGPSQFFTGVDWIDVDWKFNNHR